MKKIHHLLLCQGQKKKLDFVYSQPGYYSEMHIKDFMLCSHNLNCKSSFGQENFHPLWQECNVAC